MFHSHVHGLSVYVRINVLIEISNLKHQIITFITC